MIRRPPRSPLFPSTTLSRSFHSCLLNIAYPPTSNLTRSSQMRLYIAFVLAFLITAQAHAQDITRQKYPPPGKLIDIGGRKLHLFCEGKGSPAVILMAGGGGVSIVLAPLPPPGAAR